MNEPCECEKPGYCPRLKREALGRVYELCSGKCPAERPCEPDQEGPFNFRGTGVSSSSHAVRRDFLKCLHIGTATGGEEVCPTCAGTVRLKLFACDHPTAGPTTQSKKCGSCLFYEEKPAAPPAEPSPEAPKQDCGCGRRAA